MLIAGLILFSGREVASAAGTYWRGPIRHYYIQDHQFGTWRCLSSTPLTHLWQRVGKICRLPCLLKQDLGRYFSWTNGLPLYVNHSSALAPSGMTKQIMTKQMPDLRCGQSLHKFWHIWRQKRWPVSQHLREDSLFAFCNPSNFHGFTSPAKDLLDDLQRALQYKTGQGH